MADDRERALDRRTFLKTTLTATALLPVAGATLGGLAAHAQEAAGGGEKLVTEIQDPAISGMVTTLQYVNKSTKPDQQCSGCQLFTAGSAGRGKCQLFAQGQVSAEGWCMSWVKKVA
jgi:hypothetical protein